MKKNNPKTILLVGGGTGGHAIPILEVYKRLEKDNKLNIVVIAGRSSIDQQVFSQIDNCKTIITGKLHRRFTLTNIFEAIKFVIGMIQSYFYLVKYKPDLIFSKGGYISVPVIKLATIFEIPVFIHESDTEMGMANKIASKIAKKIFVGFPIENYKYLTKENIIYSGQIVRSDLLREENGQYGDFGFIEKIPTLLFTGGSQGSHNINDSLFKSLFELLKAYNVIHQTGEKDFEEAQKLKDKLDLDKKRRYYVTKFLGQDKNSIIRALNIADLVIGRAGANSIAEFALKGKAMILIPYQYAALDHQTKNANVLLKQKAAVVIPDRKLNSKVLIYAIKKVIGNKTKKDMLARNAKEIFPKNGLSLIINNIYKELDLA